MSNSSQGEWNAIAAAYAEIAGTDRDVVYANLGKDLWDVLGPVSGKKILDLGCGSGWLAELLREKGAYVTGVDGSERLLDIARERNPAGPWLYHDLTQGLPTSDPYDIVVSNMVLMDFDPVEPIIADISSCLYPGARVVVTMPHPAFFNYEMESDDRGQYRKVRRYLQSEGWHIATYGGHTHFHRPLSWYTNIFGRYGLLLKQLREPDYRGDIPAFCVMEFERVDGN